MRFLKEKKAYLLVIAMLCGYVLILNGFFQEKNTPQNAFAQGDVEECRDSLRSHEIFNANTCFEGLLSVEPSDQVANFFYSVTRILVLVNDSTFNDLLDRFGVSSEGRDLYNWTADFERDAEGTIILPANSPTSGEVIAFLKDILLPEVEGALTNLAAIDDTFVPVLLEPAETLAGEYLEVDYGDIALYRSVLHAVKAAILIIDAYDLDIDIDDIVSEIENDDFSINSDLLNAYANLLTLKASHSLGAAKNAVGNAIDGYFEASSSIRVEIDDQGDDLITLDSEEVEDEAGFRNVLSDIESSLSGRFLIGDNEFDDPFMLDLTRFFDNPIDIRTHLPQFTDDNDNEMIVCTFPDPTFNDILPEFDQDTLANLLGLSIPVSGTINYPAYTSGNILVTGLVCPWTSDYDFRYCYEDCFASFSSPGPYTLDLYAGEEVWIRAFCDRDDDGILTPGDYYGLYPGNPIDVISENCSGPDNIDIDLSEQVIGIKGRITSGGQPVSNAWIQVYSEKCWGGDWLGSTSTDENGYYVLNFLPEISVYVHVSANEHIGGWWDGSGVTDDCNQATAGTAGDGSTVINFELEPADTISGHVLDAQGNGISGAWIGANDYDTGNWINGSSSQQDGSYTIYLNQAYSGACRLKASVWNSNYISEYYDNKLRWEDADQVSFAPGVHHVTGIDFRLDEGGKIKGLVTDTNSVPLRWLSVAAYDFDTHYWIASSTSASDGSYRILGLPTGTYRVQAYGNQDYCGAYYDGKDNFAEADPVAVTAGEETPNINFRLLKKCRGDLDVDRDVDGLDLAAFASEFGVCTSGCMGDFTYDDAVEIDDLAVFAEGFGRTDCP